jgi:hypothetical protein
LINKKLILKVKVWYIRFWLILSMSCYSSLALANEENENKAKLTAAFIYQITKFVEWPALAKENKTTPISLCLIGKMQSSTLHYFQLLESKTSQGRRIILNIILSSKAPSELKKVNCEIFYAQQSEWQNYNTNELEALSERSLLIGSTKAFLHNGGMMSLVLVRNKMKIFFNADVIAKTPIKIESRLKALATML